MENNQHSNSGNTAANNPESKSFSNDQPGQQLPAANTSHLDDASDRNEQHSESSKPEKENETLGTP